MKIVNLQNDLLQQQRKADQERQELKDEIERTHTPHIQFGIDCKFYGPENDRYLVEFLLSANNKGNVRHNFRNIRLRVRGIKINQPLSVWKSHEPRLYFPEDLINEEVIPKENINFIFIEPGVEQIITYVTRVPATTKYILVHALFEYDKFTPHTAEKVFQVMI